jgi:hypothetical protein
MWDSVVVIKESTFGTCNPVCEKYWNIETMACCKLGFVHYCIAAAPIITPVA